MILRPPCNDDPHPVAGNLHQLLASIAATYLGRWACRAITP